MKQKWYLNTWIIAILFALWPLYGIPLILGFFLIVLQRIENSDLMKAYGDYDTVIQKTSTINQVYDKKMEALNKEHSQKMDALNKEYELKALELYKKSASEDKRLKDRLRDLKDSIKSATKELDSLYSNTAVAHYDFSEYDGLTSEECKNKISLLKNEEKELIRNNKALIISSGGSKKVIADNSKQILRCFNTECDNVLVNLSCKNIDSMRKKITTSFESLNKIFTVDGIELGKELLECKLEELNLVYTYELKKEEEKEQQKEIKAQMLEEEKVRREIEREKLKLEKDQTQCSNEIGKLMAYLQKTENDIEKQLYVSKIQELEEKLKDLETQKDNVLEREANARAGFVYIISNVGSFGEDIYKIGMTRRLEPMDRVKELSSASVPFEFDVHAMIFSDNAPELENTLHKYFEKNSVNRVNLRKEFFKVTLEEIEKVVKNSFNNTVTFTKIPTAKEYRQTLNILSSEQSA